jgi:hypothetical protein
MIGIGEDGASSGKESGGDDEAKVGADEKVGVGGGGVEEGEEVGVGEIEGGDVGAPGGDDGVWDDDDGAFAVGVVEGCGAVTAEAKPKENDGKEGGDGLAGALFVAEDDSCGARLVEIQQV